MGAKRYQCEALVPLTFVVWADNETEARETAEVVLAGIAGDDGFRTQDGEGFYIGLFSPPNLEIEVAT